MDSFTSDFRTRFKAILEVFLGAFIVFVFIWYISLEYESWMHAVFPLMFLGLLFYSKHSRKESFKDLGVRLDNWFPSFKILAATMLPFTIILLFVWSTIFPVDPIFFKQAKFYKGLVAYPFWALVQQYIFLAFFFRRLRDIFFPYNYLAIFFSAVLFSAVHIPNHPLIVLTFFGGLFWSWMYLKYKNLITIALFHGLLGVFSLTVLLMYHVVGPYADEGRWSRISPVYSAIDVVNDLKPSRKHSPINIKRSEEDFSVSGWVVGKNSEIDKVFIRMNKKDFLCEYGLKREDVAAVYDNVKYTYCGYRVKIPISDIKRGYYFIKLKIRLKDKPYPHYPDKKIWVRIQP